MWFIHTMEFHVSCGSCKHVVCFLFPLLQAACKGDSKWNKFAVSYKYHDYLIEAMATINFSLAGVWHLFEGSFY